MFGLRSVKATMPPTRATGPSTTPRYKRGLTRQIKSRPSSLRSAPLPKTMAVSTIATTEGTLAERICRTKTWVSVRESVRKTSGLSMIQASA